VIDPTGQESLARGLAWLHPAWMVASLLVAAGALRAGLVLRRARRGKLASGRDARRRHLRWAKAAVVLVGLGFLGGPLSMHFLRGRPPFETLHALLGCLAAGLFVTTALLGRRLEAYRGTSRDLHAGLGVAALLAAAAAAVAGLVLLP
jgi:hypothetical protein